MGGKAGGFGSDVSFPEWMARKKVGPNFASATEMVQTQEV